MFSHNAKMIIGLLVVFVIGGLQALHGNLQFGIWADMLIPLFLMIEHSIEGNTSN